MRFGITVANGVTGQRSDLLVDADPDTPLAEATLVDVLPPFAGG